MVPPVILDCGGYYCKVGTTANIEPTSRFRSIVSLDDDQLVVGDEKVENYVSPIERGIVTDWERLEKVWNYAFESINVNPEECSIMLTESILNPCVNRERMMEVLFESFQVQYGHIALEVMLNVYATGRTGALSVMTGDGNSQVMPVLEGYVISSGMVKSNFGGSDVTLYLMKLLEENGKLNFKRNIVNDIKEKLCDCKGESTDIVYNLPDGGTVLIGDETKKAAELMLDPSIICGEELSMCDLIMKSVQNTEIDERKFFYNNIVLGGGNSLMKHFSQRLEESLTTKLRNPTIECKVKASYDRDISAWFGGQLLASLTSFRPKWISHQDFEEYGSAIVHRC